MWHVLLLYLLIIGCSSNQNSRIPASHGLAALKNLDLDIKGSLFKAFPPHLEEDSLKFFFYLETKNTDGLSVDVDKKDLKVLDQNKKLVPLTIQHASQGKYYFIFTRKISNAQTSLSFYLKNYLIRKTPTFSLNEIDHYKSWVKPQGRVQDGIKMRLFLSDKSGKVVNLLVPPEIIVEGNADLMNLRQIPGGFWEFDLFYPNFNQIIYISVRAQGSFLGQMYRIQHIEK